jgi:uncharacterized protein YrzB (UPF0473 family)
MNNKETINIIDESGVSKTVEVVAYFTLKLNGKDYLIYTENKTDQSGNVEVYTSEIASNAYNTVSLSSITDESIWVEIKKVMLDIAKDGE